MEIGNKLDINAVFDAFEQISYAVMYKRGEMSNEYPISDTYDDFFERTFKMSFDDFLDTLPPTEKKD